MPGPATATPDIIEMDKRIERLESRVSQLEGRTTTQPKITGGFSGQGNSQTRPFTVTSTPFEITYSANTSGGSGPFSFWVVYPETGATAAGFGWYVKSDGVSGTTMCYVKPGTYYIQVSTRNSISWNIKIN